MKKKNRLLLLCCLLLQATEMFSQIGSIIPAGRRADWTIAGVNWTDVGYNLGDPSGTFDSWYDVTSNPYANLDNTGTSNCDGQLTALISALNPSHFVLLYFPEGTYKFANPINITRSNLVLRGANPWYTTFLCNGIKVEGVATLPIYSVTGKSTNSLTTSAVPSTIAAGEYIEVSKKQNMVDICPPSSYNSNYANCLAIDDTPNPEQQYGQISKVISKTGSTLTLEDNLSIDYALAPVGTEFQVRVNEVTPIKNVGIEDIRLKINPDVTTSTYTIFYKYTLNCWISGVESSGADAHQFGIIKSAKTTVTGCYIHHSNIYTDGAYGVYLGEKSTNCLVENNILVHLRHGIVLSTSMPCKNVVAYNYTDLPETANEQNIMLHGFFPNANLFEGNVSNCFEFDSYWGYNGIYNTVFRNRFLKLNSFYGQYGNVYGNTYNAALSTSVSSTNMLYNYNNSGGPYTDISYYRSSRPAFLPARFTWPVIGTPVTMGQPLSNTNPAEERFLSGGQFTINPRDEFTEYSIENSGLLSGFNAISDNPAAIYRNENDLSIGYTKFYENNTGYWDVGPMTTAIIDGLGTEEIITSYNATDGSTGIYRSTNKTNPPVSLLSQANSKVTAIVAGDFDGNGIDEYFTAIQEGTTPKLYKSNTLSNLKQTLFYTGSTNAVISCLAAGDVDGTLGGGDAGEELFIGINFNSNITRIYRNNNASTFASGTIIYENTDGYWDITALACGDFDADGDDELVEGFNSSGGAGIYKSENGDATVVCIYTGTSGISLGALAAGDLDMDGDEELVSGFNFTTQGPAIYKSEDASPAEEVVLYANPEIYWKLVSLAIEKSFVRAASIPVTTSSSTGTLSESFVSVYPNPSEGNFTLHINGKLEEGAVYRVFNMQAQQITYGALTQNEIPVNLQGQNTGIYVVQVENGAKRQHVKIVIEGK